MNEDDQFRVMNTLLGSAARMIDAAATLSRDLRSALPEDFIRRSAAILGQLFELEADVWDARPELADYWASPEGGARDIDALLAELNGAVEERRTQAEEILREVLPKSLLTRRLDDPEGRSQVQQWWAAEPKPYVPVGQLERHLIHKRRYLRIRAADFIAKRYGVDLLNDQRTDVDPQKRADWIPKAE